VSIQETWTTLKLLSWTKEYLLSKGVSNARLEAEWLLCAATDLDRVGLYLQYEKPLNETELSKYRSMVTRRARREPLQHILGTQEFYGLEFEVSRDVLIPRHDTESLVEEAMKRCSGANTILDIGTGSGCIAICLKKMLKNAEVTASDISEAALAVAKRNAARHEVEIEYVCGSLFAPVNCRKFDLIISNPPYIPTPDIETLEEEVRDFDPHSALDGGNDGLDIYRKLIPESIEYLNPKGWLMLEIGIGQGSDVVEIFGKTDCFMKFFTAMDPGGIERVVGAQRKEIQ
jgi:release factor glutamine methyltransferase